MRSTRKASTVNFRSRHENSFRPISRVRSFFFFTFLHFSFFIFFRSIQCRVCVKHLCQVFRAAWSEKDYAVTDAFRRVGVARRTLTAWRFSFLSKWKVWCSQRSTMRKANADRWIASADGDVYVWCHRLRFIVSEQEINFVKNNSWESKSTDDHINLTFCQLIRIWRRSQPLFIVRAINSHKKP